PVLRRDAPSGGTSVSGVAGAAATSAREADELPFGAGRTRSSVRELHAPQLGHLPSQRAALAPHSAHTYTVFCLVFRPVVMRAPSTAAGGRCSGSAGRERPVRGSLQRPSNRSREARRSEATAKADRAPSPRDGIGLGGAEHRRGRFWEG